jgi:hypothetical protein
MALGAGTLVATSNTKVIGPQGPYATTMDFAPMANITPIGLCTSLANPTVASATAAALGVLTPMPCVPNTIAPWMPGSGKVKIAAMSALTNTSVLNCTYGGSIRIVSPGQIKTSVGV